jgi:deazaflavin-dependent oxidoreductase (nitroreductase family)
VSNLEKLKPSPFQALLVTRGRKTGKEHAVWLRGVLHNDKIYFSRRDPDSDWFKNVTAHPEVRVEIDGETFTGRAFPVREESLLRKISELKYSDPARQAEARVAVEVTIDP